jgi:hypothetical protein
VPADSFVAIRCVVGDLDDTASEGEQAGACLASCKKDVAGAEMDLFGQVGNQAIQE